jgi:hypothetical protein
MTTSWAGGIRAVAVVWFLPALIFGAQENAPRVKPIEVVFSGSPAPAPSAQVCGFSLFAAANGPQLALIEPAGTIIADVRGEEEIQVRIPVSTSGSEERLVVEAALARGSQAVIRVEAGPARCCRTLTGRQPARIELSSHELGLASLVRLTTSAPDGSAAVRWRNLQMRSARQSIAIPLERPAADSACDPTQVMPALRPSIEQALVEWDWRLQDGIETPRESTSYRAAIQRTLQQGDCLVRHLEQQGIAKIEQAELWRSFAGKSQQLAAHNASESEWEELWLGVHRTRREIVLANPLAQVGPIVFAKQPTASFSHQLTQYLGRHARPGGGIFVLERPGRSMQCRQLGSDRLPGGSYQHPEVSYDGKHVLFSFCATSSAPPAGIVGNEKSRFHLYEIAADGSALRQLTDGPYDDFSPRYLPNDRIVFISTRRGGWHRCGGQPGRGCENHTLAMVDRDGANPHPISFHETQEWDPAVLDDGRIIYTRWDYVDRHAVYYEQLWTTRIDGSNPAIYFGNNTFNPVGIWEAQQVPGSNKVMATAAAHHAMTAGSVILVDVTRGVDGIQSITRLTPDAPFPESETRIPPVGWHAPAGVSTPVEPPVEARRWPGHCYKSPFPLSEDFFLVAYSFDTLVGEPQANPPNMFGLYLADRFGNKELLFRDLNVSSLWPTPLRARQQGAVSHALTMDADPSQGTLILQNVYASQPPLPAGAIKRLRVVQVLPKSTPGINWPRVGIPNASPGKQVLGTVPVESDGSAHFRVPANTPLSLQALDQHGRALQIMRSILYLQPGEVLSCTGCHEPRHSAPPAQQVALALEQPPAEIDPAPDGSLPLSYPLLVQPVLDRHCVQCHNPDRAEADVVLTGEPQGSFTVSYNALAPRVRYADWGGRPGDFRKVNSEPLSQVKFFGAISCDLMSELLEGHEGVVLDRDAIDRLTTWMDANVLFYGTFDHEDQKRQQLGQRIAGPALQ